MKNSIRLAITAAIVFTQTAFTQSAVAQQSQSPLFPILTAYYGIKDALATDDANAAANKAAELLDALSHVDMKSLPAKQHSTFMAVQDKLSFDARHISESKKIDHQREHFASLSTNMYALAKVAKLSDAPIYKEYCPMKKTSWLSAEQAIKNPYYGSSMSTCGKVTETIQP